MSLEPKPPAPANSTVAQAQAQFQQALALHQKGQLAQAQAIYQDILKSHPGQFDVLHLLGVIASQTRDFQRAVDLIGKAIELSPNNAAFYSNRGIALQELKQFDAAVASYDKAIALQPNHAAAYSNRGIALQGLQKLEAAIASYDQAIALKPDYAEAYFNRGRAFQELGDLEAAVASYDRAIAIRPNYAEAHANRGTALHGLQRFDGAVASYDKAIAIKPDFAEAYYNRGMAYKDLKQFEQAVASYDNALAIRPGYAEAHYNRGNALQELRRHEAAVASYDKAIAIRPDYVEAHKNRGLGYLLLGAFDRGWADYLAPPPAVLALKERLAGNARCVLLLRRDQGLGDEIFFLRFLPLLHRRGVARVLFEASPQLASILRRAEGLDGLFVHGEPLPASDETLHVSYLPLVLGHADGPPPSLAVAPLAPRVAELRARLADLGPPPYIGVTWRGGTPDMRDVLFKLAPIAAVGQTLAGLPGTLIALQRLPEQGEIALLAEAADRPVPDLTALNDDLEGMLALLSLLDDYVTVSNTNVHLRALTGRRSRVLVPCPPDFRWMAEGAESPWFPGCQVYRQEANRSWTEALAALRRDLRRTLL